MLEGAFEDDRLSGAVFRLDEDDRGTMSRLVEGESDAERPDADTGRTPAAGEGSEAYAESGTQLQAVLRNEWLQISATAWLSMEDIRSVRTRGYDWSSSPARRSGSGSTRR